jgi:DUF1680 family protein
LYRVPVVLPDKVTFAEPNEVSLNGYLGDRVRKNALVRLRAVDEDDLLDGYRKRPGRHPWIGEHVGKFLHAATLAAVQTNDPELKAKVRRVAKGLIATQEADGYLGTYLPADRWQLKPGADWDVWSHKYNLIGLLTYYRYFGDGQALIAAIRVGDLLDRTFGPGKRSLLQAGTHVGMASTSVLEPMVELYRVTGQPRYLTFAKNIVRTWAEPNGPDILRGLLGRDDVAEIANGKAYEMLSNLVGLCELARVTGDRTYLRAALTAWQSVVERHRYPTGTASYFEHFHPGTDLPTDALANVDETCVTVTWMQLNMELLRLTGDAKFGGEIERSAMNHLAGAQRPDGSAWCYYTSLNGIKPYSPETTCCLSSGPRGMALMPTLAYVKLGEQHLGINLVEASRYQGEIGGQRVTVTQGFRWNRFREINVKVDAAKPVRMRLSVRVPEWADRFTAPKVKRRGGWLDFPERTWKPGETVKVALDFDSRIGGFRGNQVVRWGPFVLAYDESIDPKRRFPETIWLSGKDTIRGFHSGGGSQTAPPSFSMRLYDATGKPSFIPVLPFADAGASGAPMKAVFPSHLTHTARESRSRAGNVRGRIADGDPKTYVVTFDGHPRAEDWYALAWSTPKRFQTVRFRHGRVFHDGGWFDTSTGKPRVEIQRVRGGAWEAVGRLEGYPATTALSAADLPDGALFELKLAEPLEAVAVRVVGVPASGDGPNQAFSSCSELAVAP